jgi:hypothetical protein
VHLLKEGGLCSENGDELLQLLCRLGVNVVVEAVLRVAQEPLTEGEVGVARNCVIEENSLEDGGGEVEEVNLKSEQGQRAVGERQRRVLRTILILLS